MFCDPHFSYETLIEDIHDIDTCLIGAAYALLNNLLPDSVFRFLVLLIDYVLNLGNCLDISLKLVFRTDVEDGRGCFC